MYNLFCFKKLSQLTKFSPLTSKAMINAFSVLCANNYCENIKLRLFLKGLALIVKDHLNTRSCVNFLSKEFRVLIFVLVKVIERRQYRVLNVTNLSIKFM